MQIQETHSFTDSEVAKTLYPWGLVAEVEPRPFDLAASIERYRQGLPVRTSTDAHPWRDDFTRALSGKRGVVTDAEALFWFTALTNPARLDADRKNQLTVEALHAFDPAESIDIRERFVTWVDTFEQRYRNVRFYSQAYLARLLLQLVGLEDALSMILDNVKMTWLSSFLDELYPGPTDGSGSLAALGERWMAWAHFHIPSTPTGVAFTTVPLPGIGEERSRYMTTLIHATQRVLPLTRPTQAIRDFLERARKSPPKPEAALYHVLNAEPDDSAFLDYLESFRPDLGRREVVLLLGRLGFDSCEWITSRVRASRRTPEEGLVGALAKVQSPRVVGALLHLAGQTTTANEAREALLRPELAYAVGLMEAAAGRTKDRALAAELLAQLEENEPELVASALAIQPEEVQATVAERIVSSAVEQRPDLPLEQWTSWMHDFALEERPQGLPRFCSAKHLRPIYLSDGEHGLPSAVYTGILVHLRDHDWSDVSKRAFGANIRVDLDTESAALAVWSIFESWARNGFPLPHIWCLYALSEFSTDGQILDFATELQRWPTMGERQRAYDALHVLEAHGSDAALAAVNKIATTSKFKGLRTRAQKLLTRLATRKGLTPGQLEDLIIDDCGLEPDGTSTFDYGTRQFRLAFDDQLAPVLRDETGKVTKSLPRPRKTDDSALVSSERERFKTMKKRLSAVLTLQARRLETALAEQRRWRLEMWEEQYVAHPLMRHLVQRLLWAECDGAKVERLFRVTNENAYADLDDEEFIPKPGSRIGLVHPLDLTEAQLAAWGAMFADYEIVPPFQQIDREVYRPEQPGTHASLDFVLVDPGWLRGHFNRRGWSKSPPTDGVMPSLYRDFHAADVRVYVGLNPGLRLDYRHDREQSLTGVWFMTRRFGESERIRLNLVGAVAYSEALYDVHLLVDRARAGESDP